MIVPMKRLVLLCTAPTAERTLEALRELKCAHLDALSAPSAETQRVAAELAQAEQAVRILKKAHAEAPAPTPAAHAESPLRTVADILAANARRAELEEQINQLSRRMAALLPYGDFDPNLARELLAQGIDLASVMDLPDPLPEERLSVVQGHLNAARAESAQITSALAAAYDEVGRITDRYPVLRDQAALAAARDALGQSEGIAWISGWIPYDAVPAVRARAVKEGWGLFLRDPAADETPPTAIRPPKLFRPVVALFEGLGIAPAYTEADVSVPFLCYFALFFAMLVGDGGYGAIILALTLWGWRKTRPLPGAPHRPRLLRSWLALLTVFSFGTVVWGLLSNTWFGAAIPVIDAAACGGPVTRALSRACNAVFNSAAVTWLGDPTYNNMMFLCFTIGVSHLMVARIWSGLMLLNDRTCLAQFGWAGIVLFMYFVTNAIVGIFPAVPHWAFVLFGISLVLVFGFTLKGSELKSRGIELGMLPLNIMSALGDIISYVRLFAVGLASVKVAQNFNDMAVNLDVPLWLKIVPMALILLVGHGLNFAMAGLSILVHAVRLNTLEFSNHKGISWAGYAFTPFARQAQKR